jgi:hypothetical protein
MHRYIPLTLVVAGTLVSATALAQASASSANPTATAAQVRAEREPREPMTRDLAATHAGQMFARMDANNDGQLTEADREARQAQRTEQRFAALDANSNGSISRAEFSAKPDRAQQVADGAEARGPEPRWGGRRGMRNGMTGGMMGGRDAMRTADADSNGAITQGEFTTAMLARFDAADADRNGTLTAEERRAARPDRGDRQGGHRGHRRGPPPAADGQSAEG